eukprot:CAMPEP_0196778182 /NCGR_PEP_ID=MMETSP1104-20130614/5642_1 /TAXON_ID=33652 /ORGANISM="Cafeteria sp., Strain Caron Lab Isolate" /LENGTH=317 /DNA_ID=CAMNT_0042148349 /DNA_START=101 /DNA_END=1054 /DNA_ORIENTATION=+
MSKPENLFALLSDDTDSEAEETAVAQEAPQAAPEAPKPAAPRGGKKAIVGSAPAGSSFEPAKPKEDRRRAPRAGATRGRGAPRGRGREFERHSGTGRGREVAKNGAGARNWGQPGDEAAEDEVPLPASSPVGEDAEAAAEAAAAAAAEAEEEAKRMSLEEYERAVLSEKRQGELFKARAVRTVKEDFGGARVLEKEEEETIGGTYQKAQRQRGPRNRKKELDATLFFSADSVTASRGGSGRGRGGFRGGRGGARGGFRGDGEGRGAPRRDGEGRGGFRGGRGGARGGAPRGAFRGGRGGRGEAPPRMDDLSRFPSLN